MITKFFGRYKGMPEAAKASLWFMVCSILQKGLAFIAIPIYTRLLTTAEYGTYSVYNAWMAMFAVFATLSISSEYYVIAVLKNDADSDEMLSILQGCSSFTCVIFYALVFILYKPFSGIFNLTQTAIVIMFVQTFFSTPMLFLTRKYQYEFKYRFIVTVTLAESVLTILVSLLMIEYFPDKSFSLILGAAIVQSLFGLILYVMNIYKGKRVYDKRIWKDSIVFCVPLLPHDLAYFVLNSSDRVMIDMFCSTAEAGIYSLAGNISVAISVITNAIGATFNPWILRKLKEKKYKDISKTMNMIVISLGVLFILVSLIMPEALLIAASSDYQDAKWAMPPILMGAYFLFIGGIPCLVSLYHEKTHIIAGASASAAAVNIVLNFISIPRFGYIAASYTTMISYACFALFHLGMARKWAKLYKYEEQPLNYKFIVFFALIITACVLTAMAFYNFPIVRYSIIVVMLFALFMKKDIIMGLIKKIRED